MMLRLDPPIPLSTPKGMGLAHFVTDYGVETNLVWTVFLESGQIWSFQNPEVRALGNETLGRKLECEISKEDFLESLNDYKQFKEKQIEEKERVLDERLHYGWNAFPQEWPESSLDICMVKIGSSSNDEYLAKLDTIFGHSREEVLVFNIKNIVGGKQFVYRKGTPHSLGFDQIVCWRRLK